MLKFVDLYAYLSVDLVTKTNLVHNLSLVYLSVSLLCNGYRVFPGGKVQLGCAVDHSPPSNAAVKKG
jgi:hypothetical protein